MSDVIWGTRRMGSHGAVSDDGKLWILGAPDWIRLPSSLGGTEHRIESTHSGPCPGCQGYAGHMVLRGTDVRVADCFQRRCGYVWYRLKEKPTTGGSSSHDLKGDDDVP